MDPGHRQRVHQNVVAPIDVVPEHGRIAIACGCRAWNDLRVRAAFDDFKAGLERRVVQRIGQLAQTAADTRNQTTFTQFRADHKTAAA